MFTGAHDRKGTPIHTRPPAVTAAALADRAGEEAASVRLYWRIVGALRRGHGGNLRRDRRRNARGRGPAQSLWDLLDEAAFRRAFEDKAPVEGLARRIPTRLVTREDAVLVGMAAIAATPSRYRRSITRITRWV